MIRIAGTQDDEALRVMAGQPMPGAVSLALRTEPSFFAAMRVHGIDPKVFVEERAGRIVATGTASRRKVFLDGVPEDVGYLSSLRVDPLARSGLALGLGYQHLLAMQQEQRLPFYLTAIMEDNSAARDLLTSDRAGLPNYQDIGRYRTTVVPLIRWPGSKSGEGIQVKAGGETGWDTVLECLPRFGSQKQFFPVLGLEDFGPSGATMTGLGLGDFLVAFSEGEAVGIAAIWDQRPFRQIVVNRYSTGTRILKSLAGAVARLTGTPRFPEAGNPLGMVYLALIAVKGNDPKVFHGLYVEALRRARVMGASFLGAGFFDDDPLGRIPRSFLHIALLSRIYRVEWADQPADRKKLDDRCKYMELGSL